MIIVKQKDFEDVVSQIPQDKRVAVVTCNTCARECKAGGKEVAEQWASKLKERGFEVGEVVVIPVCCNLACYENVKVEADVVVVLGCDAACFCIKKLYPEKDVVAADDTLALGARGDGHIYTVKKF